jgi:hypothetical protein
MGRFSRGWALTRKSWDVLKGDMSLALFPILSTIFASLALVSIWAPTLITRGVFDNQTVERNDPVIYGAGVASAYVSTFVTLFFNVALAACTARSMRGEDTKVRDGLAAAARRIGPILGWTVVATTFGLLLRAFENRVPLLGYLVLVIAVLLLFACTIVSVTLSQIFRVAVYEYALYGQTPRGFNGPQLQGAFQPA